MSSRLEIGEHGSIRVTRTQKGWIARTRYRCIDGIIRSRQATGRTKAAATRALEALLVGPPAGMGEFLTPESTIEQLAAAWLEEILILGEVGTESYDYYRRGIETLIIPELGAYQIHELRPVDVKRFYQRILLVPAADGTWIRRPSRPVWAHKVLSQMLRYAVEVGAADTSPVREIRPPRRGRKEVRVLTVELFHEVWAAVEQYDARPQRGPRRSHRLLDVFSVLAGTGARIAEALALRWCDIDLTTEPVTVHISGTLIPPRDGQPIHRQDGTKTNAGMRTITVPTFTANTLRRLRAEAGDDVDPKSPVFATRNGTWLSPNNVRREWRQCRAGRDWDWITPHSFRKTVATLIDDHYSNPDTGGTEGAGAPIAAAVLGHSNEAVTRSYYIRRMRRTPDVSAILDQALNPDRLAS